MTGFTSKRKAFASRGQFDDYDHDQDAPSTLSDTIAASFALTRREEISTAAGNAFDEGNDARAKTIAELGGNETLARTYATIPETVRTGFRAAELNGNINDAPGWGANQAWRDAYEHVRDFERRFPDQVPDDEALFETFKAKAAELRAGEQHVIRRGSGFGSFLGSSGAAMTDPLLLATLPLGASVGIGRGVLAATGRAAAVEGSIALATEIPIQAQVYQFKRALEAPWELKDSAMNVLAAGIGAGAFAGVIAGGTAGARQLLERYRADVEAGTVAPTPELEEAAATIESAVRAEEANPLAIDETPITEAHLEALDRAVTQEQAGLEVDVEGVVTGLEPDDGINQVIRRSDDPAELVDIDPTEVEVDARTFQFKGGSDAQGVTGALKDVKQFDRRLAGVALIWERKDGTRFIADGHQRLGLARRALAAGQDPRDVRLNGFVLRELDGVSAQDARQMAAIKNMAEGSGSPIDAAKILREVGPVGESLLPPLPPRSALVRQARGLARLTEDNFLAVVNEVVDARFGALVGDATADGKLQGAMLEVLRKTQPANETQARSIVQQVRTAGIETRTTEDLFGDQTITESLYVERAQVLDSALREARKDAAVFGRLVTEEDRITAAGANQLDRDANQQRRQDARNAATQISHQANTKGPLSEALTEAARSVKEGTKPGTAAKAVLKAARREILEGNLGRRETGGARPGSDAPGPQPSVGAPLRIADLAPQARPAAHQAFIARQADMSVEDLYKRAEAHQGELRAIADDVVEQMGEEITLADPGIKARATAEDKLSRKGYTGAGELTDVIRLGFMVRSPAVAGEIIDRFATRLEVLDEGVTVTGMGYVDHKALVRFSDGAVGEIQLWDEAMAAAKFGPGEELYNTARQADNINPAELEAVTEASKELYASALANGSQEWRRVAMMRLPADMRERVQALLEASGSGGVPGNISRNAGRETSSPDSSTSTGVTRDQDSPPEGTNNASTPSGTSRTTAGRNSQLKNRSAIDSPPRSIIQKSADELAGTPDNTRTGTVPDDEYDAVMARYADLVDAQGELARVHSERDGELISRSAQAAIDELDVLEDTLERVRLCTLNPREVL